LPALLPQAGGFCAFSNMPFPIREGILGKVYGSAPEAVVTYGELGAERLGLPKFTFSNNLRGNFRQGLVALLPKP